MVKIQPHLYKVKPKIKRLYKSKQKKQCYAYKGYASTNKVDILNSFNPKLQAKSDKHAVKIKKIFIVRIERV